MYVHTKKSRRKVMRYAENFSDDKKKPSRKAFLDEIVETIEQAIYEECLSECSVSVNVEYHDGWIEVYMKNDGTCEVSVCHSDNEHESPTLESTIAGMMPDWRSIQTRAEEEARKEEEFQDYLWRCCRYW